MELGGVVSDGVAAGVLRWVVVVHGASRNPFGNSSEWSISQGGDA
jgi:hypothetical protein